MIKRLYHRIFDVFFSSDKKRIRFLLVLAFSIRFLSILPHGSGITVPYRDQNTYYSLARCIVDDGYLGVPTEVRGPYIEHRDANPRPAGFYPTFHDSIAAIWEETGYMYGTCKWGEPNSFFEPLYPLISAAMYIAFGDNFFFWRLIHVILGTILVYFIYDIGKRAFKDWRVGTLAALWLCFYPHAIFYSWILMAEIVLLFLIGAGFWAYFRLLDEPRWTWAVLMGLFFAAFTLTRSFLIAFFPFMLIFVILFVKDRKRWQLAGWAALTFIVLITPWLVRNYLLQDQFVLMSTRGGYNIWMRNNPYFIEDEYRMMGVEFSPEELAALKHQDYIRGWPEFSPEQGELERNRIMTEGGVEFIKDNFGFFLKLCFIRFKYTIGWRGMGLQGPLLNGISFITYGPALLGFILSLLVGWRYLYAALPIWSVVGYFVLFYSLTHEGLRYRVPVDPLMITISVFTFLLIYSRIKHKPFPVSD